MAPGAADRAAGRLGEWIALVWLMARGFRLRHRNWRGGGAELDLVMTHRGEVVFVEVKTRGGSSFGGPLAAVDRRKQKALARAASAYLGRFDLWGEPCRFDVVGIERRRGPIPFTVSHIRDAFRADMGRQM